MAVLGATGAVGQTFVRLLADHPWFHLAEVAASERSAGKRYVDAVRWIEGTLPPAVAQLPVRLCTPADVTADIVFSALDSSVAGDVERAFAEAGRVVLSNARNFRMDPDVPLVIPEVNPGHLKLLDRQKRERRWPGALVTNANCATITLAVALAPLHERFRIRQLFVATMQAVSGAGYPGVPSLDILGNVIPFIKDEEGKIETETCKILGSLEGEEVRAAGIAVSAHANRVAVEHGHTVCMSVSFEERVSVGDAVSCLRSWRGAASGYALPSSPSPPLMVRDEPDRPQPRRDVWTGGGMTTVVGRVRADPVLDLRLVAMSHNTIRGAAGASIVNAELLAATGRLSPQ
ncbi:MAG: aspartate-semialdehyde dehydrogenase [Gemmatimonadaceae bacterium]